MDSHHRKIDLQSSSDLTYLLNNIKTAARQKIDLAIPPSAAPEGEDTYRSNVDELVQEVTSSSALISRKFCLSLLPLITQSSTVHTSDAYSRPSVLNTQRP